MLGLNDGVELRRRFLHIVVDDEIIVEVRLLEFLARADQAALNGGLGVGAAAAKSAFQFLDGGGRDKDQHGLGHLFAHLARTLHLDIQQDVHPLRHALLHISARRAVAVSHILGVLQKLVVFDHLAEAFKVHKEVFPAVDLAGPGAACGDRGGEADILSALDGLEDHRALPRAGGPGDHKEFSLFTHP